MAYVSHDPRSVRLHQCCTDQQPWMYKRRMRKTSAVPMKSRKSPPLAYQCRFPALKVGRDRTTGRSVWDKQFHHWVNMEKSPCTDSNQAKVFFVCLTRQFLILCSREQLEPRANNSPHLWFCPCNTKMITIRYNL